MSREVTVTSGDTKEDGIEVAKVVGGKDGVVGLRGRMHLGQDFGRKGLGNPDDQNLIRDLVTRTAKKSRILVDGSGTTSGLDAPFLSLGHYGRR